MHQVDVADVLFFHADDKYTCVRTAAAEHLIRTPITELAAQLDPAAVLAGPPLDASSTSTTSPARGATSPAACSCASAATRASCR